MWIRNMYTGVGGGMYTRIGWGLYTGPGGGMYTGPDLNPYRVKHSTWPIFAKELRKIVMMKEAQIIKEVLRRIGWR